MLIHNTTMSKHQNVRGRPDHSEILGTFGLGHQALGTVSKASEKRIFKDLLSRLIDLIEEPAPGFA